MRKALFGAAVAACLAATPLTSKPVAAMALPAPAGMNAAIDALSVTQQASCRVIWRCGYYGCGWRRVCVAPTYSYYAPYSYYRPYYRPYYRSYVSYYRPYVSYYRPYPRPLYRPYVSYDRPYYRPAYRVYYGAPRFYGGYRPYYAGYRYGGFGRYW